MIIHFNPEFFFTAVTYKVCVLFVWSSLCSITVTDNYAKINDVSPISFDTVNTPGYVTDVYNFILCLYFKWIYLLLSFPCVFLQ